MDDPDRRVYYCREFWSSLLGFLLMVLTPRGVYGRNYIGFSPCFEPVARCILQHPVCFFESIQQLDFEGRKVFHPCSSFIASATVEYLQVDGFAFFSFFSASRFMAWRIFGDFVQ